MCSLVPGLLGKGLFIDFIFLIENPRSKATWLRGLPPIVNEIAGLGACVGLHQPCLTGQHLRKTSIGTVHLGRKLPGAAAWRVSEIPLYPRLCADCPALLCFADF